MTKKHRYNGMTLIELMTVIAIIAVLAAILLPVISTVRETGRQATCLSNMHSIYIAVSQYRDDNSTQFPPMLLGPAEDANGNPAVSGATAMPIQQMQHAFLYRKYINDITVFHCPDNPTVDSTSVTQAVYDGPPSPHYATFASMGIPWTTPSTQIPYYAYDSYDITMLDREDAVAKLVYARDWTGGLSGTPTSGTADPSNQMKYREAPLDQTVITWCNFHAIMNGSSMCPVLLASGTAKPVPYNVISTKGWTFASPG